MTSSDRDGTFLSPKRILPLVLCLFAMASGCAQTENYQQYVESHFYEAQRFLRVTKPLDAGNTVKTRQDIMDIVFVDLNAGRFYSVEGLTSLTANQRDEYANLSRQTLDYMLLHKDDLDLTSPLAGVGMRAMRYFLTSPADVKHLSELSDHSVKLENKQALPPK